MILNPRYSPSDGPQPATTCVPAWDAVFRAQKASASNWWLVAQPDHAALARDLSERIQSRDFPALDDEVLQAIALHDEGWKAFDNAPMAHDGRPLSFLDLGPADFLQAWRDSIACAERVGPVAGLLVSEHFLRLGQVHLETRGENPDVREFVKGEAERQERLLTKQRHSISEIAGLVDVLQFCDLLSLYLCCGSQENVEFPQKFNGRSIRLRREGEVCRIEPKLFGEGLSLGVSARKYPGEGGEVTIPVLVA